MFTCIAKTVRRLDWIGVETSNEHNYLVLSRRRQLQGEKLTKLRCREIQHNILILKTSTLSFVLLSSGRTKTSTVGDIRYQ